MGARTDARKNGVALANPTTRGRDVVSLVEFRLVVKEIA